MINKGGITIPQMAVVDGFWSILPYEHPPVTKREADLFHAALMFCDGRNKADGRYFHPIDTGFTEERTQ